MSEKQRLFLEVADTHVLASATKIPDRFPGAKAVAGASVGLDLMFVHFILKHEGGNKNGDYFTKDELEACYATYAGKPITWEHGQPYIGFITDAMLVKPGEEAEDPRWYVECAGVIWKSRYPQQAALIAQGTADGSRRISMECYFRDALYTVGESLEKLYTATEAPELVTLRGHKLHGQPVYRVLVGCHGGGAGIVENPADVDAFLLSVAKSEVQKDRKIVINHEQCSAYVSVSNMEGFFESTGGVEPTCEEKEVEEMNLDKKDDLVLEEEATTQATESDQSNTPTEELEDNVQPEVVTEDTQATEESEDAQVDEDVADTEPGAEGNDEQDTEEAVETEAEVETVDEVSVVERFSAEAATFNEYMEKWGDMSTFWRCFDALYKAVDDALLEGGEVVGKVKDAIDSFAREILTVLPKVMEHWGIASAEQAVAEFDEKVNKLQAENASLKVKLVEANEAFEQFKQELEEEKAEAARVALANDRLQELTKAGVTIPEGKLESWTDRLKHMDEEAYADFKDVLVANVTKEEATDEADESEASVDNLEQAEANHDLPPLNIEQKTQSIHERYEKLWEKILAGEQLHKRY